MQIDVISLDDRDVIIASFVEEERVTGDLEETNLKDVLKKLEYIFDRDVIIVHGCKILMTSGDPYEDSEE